MSEAPMKYLCLMKYKIPALLSVKSPDGTKQGEPGQFGIVGFVPIFETEEAALEFGGGAFDILPIVANAALSDVPEREL